MTTSVFIVRADEDRLNHPVHFLNGRFNTKIAARDTADALLVIDTIRTGRGGPPLHYHNDVDEMFLVREGQFRFQVGDNVYDLDEGDVLFGPRGIPHAFRNISENGRLMVMFQPAGSMEAFFSAQLFNPMSDEFRALSRAHGMEVVGPPLAA